MIRSIRYIGLAMLSTAAILAGTAGQASASTKVYNALSQYLSASPSDGMATACHSKRSSLVDDDYVWAGFFYSKVNGTFVEPELRNIHLGAGDYTWTDCLKPKDGYYIHTSTLDPDNPAWKTASVSEIVVLYPLLPGGETIWGSQLIR
ncbi:hypothetical protein OG555_24455 [Kribbella sp. NBC_01484]|uniref:hypothetical protein n=1 Tax=Kribbella sp. NBC_01484 TaxID=2903579 RepID=UPI002E2F0881|nr:hypothetical protein [Kribbella sp. NBC_01484]